MLKIVKFEIYKGCLMKAEFEHVWLIIAWKNEILIARR